MPPGLSLGTNLGFISKEAKQVRTHPASRILSIGDAHHRVKPHIPCEQSSLAGNNKRARNPFIQGRHLCPVCFGKPEQMAIRDLLWPFDPAWQLGQPEIVRKKAKMK